MEAKLVVVSGGRFFGELPFPFACRPSVGDTVLTIQDGKLTKWSVNSLAHGPDLEELRVYVEHREGPWPLWSSRRDWKEAEFTFDQSNIRELAEVFRGPTGLYYKVGQIINKGLREGENRRFESIMAIYDAVRGDGPTPQMPVAIRHEVPQY